MTHRSNTLRRLPFAAVSFPGVDIESEGEVSAPFNGVPSRREQRLERARILLRLLILAQAIYCKD